jgi:hypothetical protein
LRLRHQRLGVGHRRLGIGARDLRGHGGIGKRLGLKLQLNLTVDRIGKHHHRRRRRRDGGQCWLSGLSRLRRNLCPP